MKYGEFIETGDPSRPALASKRFPGLLACTAVTTIIHIQIVLATTLLSFFSGFARPRNMYHDVALFFKFARAMSAGSIPYRDFPVEYPVLALPFFAAPSLIGSSFQVYKVAFVAEMLLVDCWLTYLIASHVRETEGIERVPERLAWYSLCFAALCPLAVVRFDLGPSALAFAAAHWWMSGRRGVAGGVAGVGTLVKVFPIAILVPAVAQTVPCRETRRAVLIFAGTILVGSLGWWALAGQSAAYALLFHARRGLEVESIYAGFLMAAGLATGGQMHTYFGHGCMNLHAPGSASAATLAPFLQAAALLLVAAHARRASTTDSMRYAAAAVLSLAIAGKVFSPQYLIWAFPFIGSLGGSPGRAARPLFLACCLLTTAVYPHLYDRLISLDPVAINVLVWRNLAAVTLFAVLLRTR